MIMRGVLDALLRMVALFVLLILVAIVVATMSGRVLPGLRARSRDTGRRSDRNRLLRICLGDRERMARLIDLELKRNPTLTEEHAVRRAIESYERDNR